MSLLKLRGRWRTVKSLNSIFAALQVVTVVRTQRIREKYHAMERYLGPLKEVLSSRLQVTGYKSKTLVVITSNRGLCGNFNKAAVGRAEQYLKQNPNAKLIVFGKNGVEALKRKGYQPAVAEYAAAEKPDWPSIAAFFRQHFSPETEFSVAYNSYKSTVVQVPTVVKLHPQPVELVTKSAPVNLLVEPDRSTLQALYQHYLEARFFRIVLESQMGELGARLMVLKGAVDTSKEMISEIQLAINKARQAAITRELLEIVSAAEAVRESYE